MAMSIEAITKKDIVDKLKKIGLKQTDHVIVHSSLSSFGKVAGGPGSVIDALIEVVGAEGTVIVPTFCDNHEAFDSNKSETNLGLIPQIFLEEEITSILFFFSLSTMFPMKEYCNCSKITSLMLKIFNHLY